MNPRVDARSAFNPSLVAGKKQEVLLARCVLKVVEVMNGLRIGVQGFGPSVEGWRCELDTSHPTVLRGGAQYARLDNGGPKDTRSAPPLAVRSRTAVSVSYHNCMFQSGMADSNTGNTVFLLASCW